VGMASVQVGEAAGTGRASASSIIIPTAVAAAIAVAVGILRFGIVLVVAAAVPQAQVVAQGFGRRRPAAERGRPSAGGARVVGAPRVETRRPAVVPQGVRRRRVIAGVRAIARTRVIRHAGNVAQIPTQASAGLDFKNKSNPTLSPCAADINILILQCPNTTRLDWNILDWTSLARRTSR